ncbi:MAG TPA: efflux RND transporter periplasmic adaptor subunit [Candidatus Polarisedimenticolia bacterium]|nr:efflux RND transporter periplasmic adaptor subunit [Candidatus Polarisedimenticolia bacterium]
MKKVLIVVGLVVVIAAVVLASLKQGSRRGTKVYEEEVKRVDRLVSTVKASGEIQPRVYVNISSQVPGEIVDLRVKEGDRVRRGQVLLQLDPEQYRAAVARLEANLRLARINLQRERASLATHQTTLQRQEALARSEVLSPEMLDQARLLVETTRIQTQALEEQIRQAEADLEKARDELAKTTIEAPIEGLVTKVNAKLGEQVIIGTMNNPGTVILVLSDMSAMLAEVRVDETEVAQVRAGQSAQVTVDAVEGRTFEGFVTEIAHTALKERDVSRFTVKVSMTGPGSGAADASKELGPPVEVEGRPGLASLRPGMSAHAAIEVASKEGAVVVPIQAVVSRTRKEMETASGDAAQGPSGEEGTDGTLAAAEETKSGQAAAPAAARAPEGEEDVEVIFVDRKGKAEMVAVTTGLSDEFNVEILNAAGVQPGDKVVIGPYRTLKKLKPGDAVVKVEKDEDLKEQS